MSYEEQGEEIILPQIGWTGASLLQAGNMEGEGVLPALRDKCTDDCDNMEILQII